MKKSQGFNFKGFDVILKSITILNFTVKKKHIGETHTKSRLFT